MLPVRQTIHRHRRQDRLQTNRMQHCDQRSLVFYRRQTAQPITRLPMLDPESRKSDREDRAQFGAKRPCTGRAVIGSGPGLEQTHISDPVSRYQNSHRPHFSTRFPVFPIGFSQLRPEKSENEAASPGVTSILEVAFMLGCSARNARTAQTHSRLHTYRNSAKVVL
ncbi:hypothetical protein VTK56DRAFT_665 [Thermocarpiscus australiensis]